MTTRIARLLPSRLPAPLAAALVAASLAACQSVPPPPAPAVAPPPSVSLIDAGFVARKPTTSKQMAKFGALPPNKMVKHVVKGKVSYLYADPDGCGCVYVGDQAAYGNYSGMQNTMLVMTQQQLGADDQLAPGLSPTNIEDLGSWAPF
jgi:hypothetical protein